MCEKCRQRKRSGHYGTTGKVPSWNNETEMQPSIENSGAQLFNKLEVSALVSIRS